MVENHENVKKHLRYVQQMRHYISRVSQPEPRAMPHRMTDMTVWQRKKKHSTASGGVIRKLGPHTLSSSSSLVTDVAGTGVMSSSLAHDIRRSLVCKKKRGHTYTHAHALVFVRNRGLDVSPRIYQVYPSFCVRSYAKGRHRFSILRLCEPLNVYEHPGVNKRFHGSVNSLFFMGWSSPSV